MELIKCHLVLEKRPAELRFVIDKGDFRNWVRLGSWGIDMSMIRGKGLVCATCVGTLTKVGVKFLWDRLCRFLQFLEKAGCDGQVVNAGKRLDLSNLKMM